MGTTVSPEFSDSSRGGAGSAEKSGFRLGAKTERLFPVCPVGDLPPGERRIVNVDGRSIGVFNVKGEFFAIRNVCPHQRAPLCEGAITGTTSPGAVGEYHWEREGEIIRCPWHGWEFDITTGKSIFNPNKLRVASYKVDVQSAKDVSSMVDDSAPCAGISVAACEVSVSDGLVVLHL